MLEVVKVNVTKKLSPQWHMSPATNIPILVPVTTRASNKGYAKVREDFTIMEKAPTRAFSCTTTIA